MIPDMSFRSRIDHPISLIAVLGLGLFLLSCSGSQAPRYGTSEGPAPASRGDSPEAQQATGAGTADYELIAELEKNRMPREAATYPGSGEFVALPSSGTTQMVREDGEGIHINLVDVDLATAIEFILGETLNLNYIYDSNLKGSITVRTTRPLPREHLLSALETILDINGMVLIEAGGVYKVVPRAAARSGAALDVGTRRSAALTGFGYQIVPLKYITAPEMEKILRSTAPEDSVVHVDKTRNVLVLAGTQSDLNAMLQVVESFDLDLLAGMSFGLFPVRFVAATTLAEDLEEVFNKIGEESLSGLLSVVPIEHLNSILVVARRPDLLEHAEAWIGRLDQSGDGSDRRIYVYYVKNTRAEDLANALNQVFVEDEAENGVAGPADISGKVAPGLVPVELTTEGAAVEPPPAGGYAPETAARLSAPGERALSLPEQSRVRIIAETKLNALIILATPEEYRMIEGTLKQLDIVPLQVLIEASVYEVRLTDDLAYGIRWFLSEGNHTLEINNLPAVAGSGAFSYLFSTDNFVASLEALAAVTDLRVVSSPELMVLNNRTARLQVGDQVPVASRSAISVTDPDAPVVNEIQYRNTGVILDVTPQVNVGGLITMEISQEISDVAPSEDPTVTPTIFQRSIQSSVAVHTGESVALGGLISDSARSAQRGVPLLMDIPILGNLFRSNSEEGERTELLILITPTIVRDKDEARRVSDEIQKRMRNVHQLIDEHRAKRKQVPDEASPEGESGGGPVKLEPERTSGLERPDRAQLALARQGLSDGGQPVGEASLPAESASPKAASPEAIFPKAPALEAAAPKAAAAVAMVPAQAATASEPAAPPAPESDIRSQDPERPAVELSAGLPAEDAAAAPESDASEPTSAMAPSSGNFMIQLVALSLDQTEAVWKQLQEAHPRLLGELPLSVETAEVQGKTYHRVQAGPFPDHASAVGVCARLKARKQGCLVVRR
jgi:general secretion pathway protein D